MNKHRRKVIAEIFSQLVEILDNLEAVIEEENEAMENTLHLKVNKKRTRSFYSLGLFLFYT